MSPTVTVGIPHIQPRQLLLQRAVASVDAQTHQPDSIVIHLDVYREGPALTRNRILDQVTTDYVAWLDDDDELLPHHLETCMKYAEAEDADLVYPWYKRFDRFDPFGSRPPYPVGKAFNDELREHLLTKNNFIPVTTVIRTELLKEVGGFPLPWVEDWPHPSNEDWGLWRRLLRAGARFTHAPSETWIWHRHGIDRRSTRMIGT